MAGGTRSTWAKGAGHNWESLFPPKSDSTKIHPNNRFLLGMGSSSERAAFVRSSAATERLYALLKEIRPETRQLLFNALKRDLSWDPNNPSPLAQAHQDDLANLLLYVHSFRKHASMPYWLEALAGTGSAAVLGDGLGASSWSRRPSQKRVWMLLRKLDHSVASVLALYTSRYRHNRPHSGPSFASGTQPSTHSSSDEYWQDRLTRGKRRY